MLSTWIETLSRSHIVCQLRNELYWSLVGFTMKPNSFDDTYANEISKEIFQQNEKKIRIFLSCWRGKSDAKKLNWLTECCVCACFVRQVKAFIYWSLSLARHFKYYPKSYALFAVLGVVVIFGIAHIYSYKGNQVNRQTSNEKTLTQLLRIPHTQTHT